MKQSSGLKYGLIAGLALVGYFLLFYWMDIRLMLNSWIVWGSLVIYALGMYLACESGAKTLGGAAHFRTYLRTAFMVFVIANAFYYILYFVLHNTDPQIAIVQHELIKEKLARHSVSLPETMQKQLGEGPMDMTLQDAFFGFCFSLLGGFVMALILALFFDRRKNVNLAGK